jgi:hypothetical protein
MSVLSLSDLKADLQIAVEDTSQDAMLQNLLDSAEDDVAHYLGTVFVGASDTLPTQNYKTHFETLISPPIRPIINVSEVKVDDEVLDASLYEVYDCYIQLFVNYDRDKVVNITYTGGYQGIPAKIRELVFLTVDWYLKLKTSIKPGTAIDTRLPDFVKDKLDLYRCVDI